MGKTRVYVLGKFLHSFIVSKFNLLGVQALPTPTFKDLTIEILKTLYKILTI